MQSEHSRSRGRIRLLWLSLFISVSSRAVFSAAAAGQEVGGSGESERVRMAVEAVTRLQGVQLDQNPKLKETVFKLLEKTRGTPDFVKLVQQFNLTNQGTGLLEVAVQYPAAEAGIAATRLLLASAPSPLLGTAWQGTNISVATKLAEALGHTGEKAAAPLLLPLVADAQRDAALRKQAVRSLARTSQGAAGLLRLVQDGRLADDLKFTASAELNHVRWPEIKALAATLLPLPQARNQPLPPLTDLLKLNGDPAHGA